MDGWNTRGAADAAVTCLVAVPRSPARSPAYCPRCLPTLLFRWFVTRSASKDAITSVSAARTVPGVWCLRFEDSGQLLADAHVHLPVRAQRIIDELRQCGYAVTDRKTGQPVARLPKRWHAA